MALFYIAQQFSLGRDDDDDNGTNLNHASGAECGECPRGEAGSYVRGDLCLLFCLHSDAMYNIIQNMNINTDEKNKYK